MTITKKISWKESIKTFTQSIFGLDHSLINLVPALRTGILLGIGAGIFYDDKKKMMPFVYGIFWVAVSDPSGSVALRVRFMGLTLISCLADITFITLTYKYPIARIATSFVLGLKTYFLAFGMGPFIAGRLALMMYAIFGGVFLKTPPDPRFSTVFWFFAGGSFSLAVAILPDLVGTLDAIRTEIFKVWHGLGKGLNKWGENGIVPHLGIAQLNAATAHTKACGAYETKECYAWLERIVQSAGHIRVFAIALAASGNAADLTPFIHAVGIASVRIAEFVQFPWLRWVPFIKTRMKDAVGDVRRNADTLKAGGNIDESWIAVIEVMLTDIESTVERIMEYPYPRGSLSLRRLIAAFGIPVANDPTGSVLDFSVRVAIAYTLGTVAAAFITDPKIHSYWFPTTVAIIMVPGGTGRSLDRLSRRMLGTILGACLVSVLSLMFKWPELSDVIQSFSGGLAIFFGLANFTWFVFFLTCFIEPTGVAIGYRIAWTLAAGLLVLAVTLIYPRPTPELIGEKLALQAKSVKDYAVAVLATKNHTDEVDRVEGGDGIAPTASETSLSNEFEEKALRKAATLAQIAVMICLNDSIMTPQKFRIDPFILAREIMSDLANASAIPASIEFSLGKADGLLQYLSEDALTQLDRLVERLEGNQPAKVVVPQQIEERSSCSTDPFSGAIANAHQRLDMAGL